jgi:TonB family protein
MPSPSPAASAQPSDRAPKPIFAPAPIYPRDDLAARIRGVVALRVLVSRSGVPLDIVVVKSARGRLTEAAVEAVRRWRFEPAVRGGRSVDEWTQVEIPFEAIPYPTAAPPTATPTPASKR